MILHFLKDEKVADQIIENFGRIGENIFLIFVSDLEQSYKYITSTSEQVTMFSFKNDNINDVIKKHSPIAIILHQLNLEFAQVVLKIQFDLRIGWYEWGADLYSLPKIKPNNYAPLTNSYLLETNNILFVERFVKRVSFLRSIYYKRIKKTEDYISILFQAINKISFFISYIEEDFQVFSNHYQNKLHFINCAFSNLDQYLGGNKNIELLPDAQNILIGNSNTPESNHLDVFNLLSINIHDFISKNIKVFTPLSYGGNERYRRVVIKAGKELLGNSFSPMLEFIGRQEYIKILGSCSVGIFYHFRQQGMGNIIAMLYMGARIYMSPKNPAYLFFIRNKIKVFDLDKEFVKFGSIRLNAEIVKQNRIILQTIFSKERIQKDIYYLNQQLKEANKSHVD